MDFRYNGKALVANSNGAEYEIRKHRSCGIEYDLVLVDGNRIACVTSLGDAKRIAEQTANITQ